MKKDRRTSKPAPRRMRSYLPVVLMVVLAALTAAVYYQAAGFELINYDDDIYVTDRHQVTSGLSPQGIRWAFTTSTAANWHPLTWISLMADAQFGRGRPGAYHITNVLLHVLSVLLLFSALQTATGSIWRSAFVAALFAVHPLHAESVAWVAERKDVLSTVFWMLTMLIYVRLAGRLTPLSHVLLAAVYATGLLAKPMLVSLPIVLLLLDHWPLGRCQVTGHGLQETPAPRHPTPITRLIAEKAPLFVLAAASCAVTFWAQRAGGAVRPLDIYPMGVRLANAAVAYVGYLGKAVWPVDLSPFYPHAGSSLPEWQVVGSVIAIAAATYAAIRYRREAPYVFVGWLWYVTTLVPVIGIIQVGDQAMADRYTYVPLVGVFVMAAWIVPALVRSRVLAALAVGVIIALTIAAYRQVGYWRDSETLFSHAVRIDPSNALAFNNLGGAQLDDATSDPDKINARLMGKAMHNLQRSLEIKPNYVEAMYNLGTALGRSGRTDEAVEVLQKALDIRPGAAKVRNNLGMVMMNGRDYSGAEIQFREAIRIEPDMSQAHSNLAYALYKQGRYEEAIPPARTAVQMDPDSIQAHINLGNSLARLQRFAESVEHYTRVLELDPTRANIRNNLAVAYEHLDRFDEALDQLRAAVEYKPNDPAIRAHYERLLAARGTRP